MRDSNGKAFQKSFCVASVTDLPFVIRLNEPVRR